jgi:uncharacterized membrane protein YqjE
VPASAPSSLRRAADAVIALLLARAEFASVELSIAVQGALRWLLMALASCVMGMLALIALSAAIVLGLWDRLGWYSVLLLALLYCAATVLLVQRLLAALARARPLLAQTFIELAKDRAALASLDPARPAPEAPEDA